MRGGWISLLAFAIAGITLSPAQFLFKVIGISLSSFVVLVVMASRHLAMVSMLLCGEGEKCQH